MHDDQPTLIMVKRAIAGPEIITPGMGYKKARKAMLHAEGLDAGAPCPSSGPAEHPAPAQMDKPRHSKAGTVGKTTKQLSRLGSIDP